MRFDGWKAIFPDERYEDPKLVDPFNRNFSLQASSPAIDAGIDVGLTHDFENNVRPQGLGFDIGAFESEGVTEPWSFITASDTYSGLEWGLVARLFNHIFENNVDKNIKFIDAKFKP